MLVAGVREAGRCGAAATCLPVQSNRTACANRLKARPLLHLAQSTRVPVWRSTTCASLHRNCRASTTEQHHLAQLPTLRHKPHPQSPPPCAVVACRQKRPRSHRWLLLARVPLTHAFFLSFFLSFPAHSSGSALPSPGPAGSLVRPRAVRATACVCASTTLVSGTLPRPAA